MSWVVMRVLDLSVPPYEMCELLTRDEVRHLTEGMKRKPFQRHKPGQTVRWECSYSCRTIVTPDHIYRQISTTCGRHRCLIPAKQCDS